MTTTLTEIADRAQLALNDAGAGTWAQATVEAWIRDGIRDYSQTFPMHVQLSITISGADPGHVFDLFTGIIAVTNVEYPGDEDPPIYLKRRARTHPRFYGVKGFYDYQPTDDATSAPQLYLSEEPADGEKVYIWVTMHHTIPAAGGNDITVPAHHEGLLILFCLWCAFKERLATEEQDPDTTLAGAVTLLQQLVKGAEQAELEYRRALDRAKANIAVGGPTGPWTVDDHDRIY